MCTLPWWTLNFIWKWNNQIEAFPEHENSFLSRIGNGGGAFLHRLYLFINARNDHSENTWKKEEPFICEYSMLMYII